MHVELIRAVLPAVLLAVAVQARAAETLFVDDDAPPGGDGASWDTAFRFLADALVAAAGGAVCEIRIAQGLYRPDRTEASPEGSGDREATFQLQSQVAVVGGFAGLGADHPDARDVAAYQTILSGDLLGDDRPDFTSYEDNALHVTRLSRVEGAVLDGVTVSSGNAGDGLAGGGILVWSSSVTIVQCTFTGNRGFYGGAIGALAAELDLSDCSFAGNVADRGGAVFNDVGSVTATDSAFDGNSATRGGAIDSFRGTLAVEGCAFADNTATIWGGALRIVSDDPHASVVTLHRCAFRRNEAGVDGGAAYISLYSAARISECSLTENIAQQYGGAIWISIVSGVLDLSDSAFAGNLAEDGGALAGYTGARVVRCTFSANAASGHGGGVYWLTAPARFANCSFQMNVAEAGGAVAAQNSIFLRLINCTLHGNTALAGGAVHAEDADVALLNSTIAANEATATGGGLAAVGESSVHVANGILWQNVPDQISLEAPSTATVIASDVDGGFPGAGNIDADPLFVNAAGGDLRLGAGSPAIDAGFNAAVPDDADDLDSDDHVDELTPLDLDGNPRFADVPATADTGCGTPVITDMGAYERPGIAFDVKRGDIDGDGVVGTSDLLALLVAWGPVRGDCALQDLDLDGVVGPVDLDMLLASWEA